jgi:acyl carrier protein
LQKSGGSIPYDRARGASPHQQSRPMNRDDFRARLQQVFREVFEDEEFEFSDALSRENLKVWDSLGHIRLVAALEETFGVAFTIEEIETFTSAGKIAECVSAKL